MKLVQCISEFIFPTENHMVICSAHERKAAGHLKVGCISLLTSHFPLSNMSKIIDFVCVCACVCPLFLLYQLLQAYSCVLYLAHCVPLCCSTEFDRSRVLESPLNSAIQRTRRASLLHRFMGIWIRLLIFIHTLLIHASSHPHLPPLFRASFTCSLLSFSPTDSFLHISYFP